MSSQGGKECHACKSYTISRQVPLLPKVLHRPANYAEQHTVNGICRAKQKLSALQKEHVGNHCCRKKNRLLTARSVYP